MQIQPRLTSLQCQYSNILYMGILSVMMDCKSFILQQPIIRGQIIKNQKKYNEHENTKSFETN
jgi:hypothetical protein